MYLDGGEQSQEPAREGGGWPGGWDPAQQAKLPLQENNNYYAADPSAYDLHQQSGYPEVGQPAVATADYSSNGEVVDNAPAGSYYQPELTLDETGQWYFDYNQQQWFPYHQQLEQQQQQQSPPLEAGGGEEQQQPEQAGVETDLQHHQLDQDYSQQPAASLPIHNDSNLIALHQEELADVTAGIQGMALHPQESVESRGWEEAAPSSQTAGWGRQDSHLSSGIVDPAPEQSDVDNLPELAAQEELLGASTFEHRPSRESSFQPDGAGAAAGSEASLGPPDLVDHRPNTLQPEIVSDLTRSAYSESNFVSQTTAHQYAASSVPPPDMFASLPVTTASSTFPSSHTSSNVPDLAPSGVLDPPMQPPYGAAPDVMPSAPPLSGFAPDITSQSVIQNNSSSNHMNTISHSHLHSIQPSVAVAPVSETAVSSHDQHYDFYNRQFVDPTAVAMPDIMAGRGGGGGSHLSQPPPQPSLAMLRPLGDSAQSCGKAPDILRTEPLVVVPSSDRNVYMETGELMEEDAARVSLHQQQQQAPPLAHPSLLQQHHHVSPVFLKPSSGLPPMDGGNELLENEVRMVVGESDAVATPANSSQRMVEGESSSSHSRPTSMQSQPPPPLASVREVEGESVLEPLLSVATRTIEGEDGPSVPPLLPPPASGGPPLNAPLSRSSSGQSTQLPGPPPPQAAPPGGGRGVAPGFPSPQHQQTVSSSSRESPSLFSSTLLDSSPIYPPGRTEARSAAAGSERRDQSMMGGPPLPRSTKAPPLPTPGRDIAGEEAIASSAYSGARRRGDEHKKSTYDSDDVDRNEDSDLESDRDREPRYPQPRRTVSPGWCNLLTEVGIVKKIR